MPKRTATPETGNPYFRLSESDEQRLWRARDLINTLAELALASASKHGVIKLPAEALSTTLFLAAELLDLPMTYVPANQEV